MYCKSFIVNELLGQLSWGVRIYVFVKYDLNSNFLKHTTISNKLFIIKVINSRSFVIVRGAWRAGKGEEEKNGANGITVA